MKTSDVPHLSEPRKSERKAEPKGEPKAEPKAASKPRLAQAGASSDPVVHRLLARRQNAYQRGDTADANAVTAALAELGYE